MEGIRRFIDYIVVGSIVLLASSAAVAQSPPERRSLITGAIDETELITLAGNTRKEMTPAHDRGAVADDLVLRMYLQLNRAPEVQQAMDELVDQLHDQKSSQYHQWRTAEQIAAQFGPAESDVEAVTGWLRSHGFTVNLVYRANGVIDFSGPASAIRETFHTEIHQLSVNGKSHMANAGDPKIPATLAAAVHGIVSLHNFRPHPLNHPRPEYTYPCTPATCILPPGTGSTWYALVPDDLYAIYDFQPLFAAGITGIGQTIVVVEDSDVYSTADWQTFRATFGLAQRFPQGSFTQIHPQPREGSENGTTCTDPGLNVNSDDFEAAIDVEWASAAAPNARIVAASCANIATNFNSGVFIALQNIVSGRAPAPALVSVSYGSGESENGASFNAYVNSLYETAVLQGVSVFVGSGDGGADGDSADQFSPAATHGINVSGFASTPFNVAVGGTDFADTYFGTEETYWNSTNGPYQGSALSYVPEIPWNGSCGSELFASYFGYATTYGADGLCKANSILGESFAGVGAGSGGASACAYGAASIPGVVGGTCRGYQKPLYQRLVKSNPRDGVRDLPDVSLFASNGEWNHYYVACFSDLTNFGAPCVGAPINWAGGGGTSFSSPIMAGIQALINQTTGERQGNPNYVYYALGALEYDLGGTSQCNSTLGNQINPRCVFHDVTLGDNIVNCLPLTDSKGNTIGTFNCYIPSGTNGVISLSNTSYEPAYKATPGWDFATGLGSVDAYNLVKAWPGSRLHQ